MNPGLSKTAQAGNLISGLVDKVKNYFGSKVDPNDKSGSLINMLAPGALSLAFKAMGFGWLGVFFSFLMSVFHVDVSSILSSIWGKLKSAIGGGKQTSSEEVDNIVSSSVAEHNTPPTQEEADAAAQAEEQKKNSSQLLRDAKMLKLALIEFDKHNMQVIKTAGFLSLFTGRKTSSMNILTKLLSWVFKVAIASAGLMLAGDVVNKFLGRSNSLDGTMQNGKPTGNDAGSSGQAAPAGPTSTQTKFKVQPSYHAENRNVGESSWIETIPNNKQSIEDMLVVFAKQVYSGLDGLESVIKSTAGLQVIAEKIEYYNHTSAGDQMVYIPRYFNNKKQIVDMFIDEVAEKTK
jgi:hypothetical protein